GGTRSRRRTRRRPGRAGRRPGECGRPGRPGRWAVRAPGPRTRDGRNQAPAACRLLPENLAVLTIPDFIRAGACCRAKSFTEGTVRTFVRDRGSGLRYACDRDHVRAAL